MITDCNQLKKEMLDTLKSILITSKRDGVVVNIDGTLMSIVNACIAKDLLEPFKVKFTTCIFNNNKYYLTFLSTLIKDLELDLKIIDLSKDLESLSLYKNCSSPDQEIILRKRLTDSMLYYTGDKHNLAVLGNLCLSQWQLNFPHRCYKSEEQIYILYRLYYSEVQQLAEHLGLSKILIERKPSHHLFRNKYDEDMLGFTYQDMEDYVYGSKEIKTHKDKLIRDTLTSNTDWSSFKGFKIQRPNKLLKGV